jgi:hypothetical protein
VKYDIDAFVKDPVPGWACPGTIFQGGEFYFAAISIKAFPESVPKNATLVIHKPSASECVAVKVADDAGNVLTNANMFICPLAPDGTPCASNTFPNRDPDGTLRLTVDPNVTYRLTPFIVNSGWPCVQYTDPATRDTFHFGASRDITGTQLLASTVTLTIHKPTASECVAVKVTDDAGTVLTNANMFICPLAADGTPCASNTFPNRDPDGTLRLTVDPNVTYRLTPFIVNSGWPCVQYTDPATGDTFHFGASRDITGTQLLASTVTLTIHKPTASECV